MNRYVVKLASRAVRDIDESLQWERTVSARRGAAWTAGLLKTLRSLETLPERCPIISQHALNGKPVHQKIFGANRGVYKILFQIDKLEVRVVHCRHAARHTLETIGD